MRSGQDTLGHTWARRTRPPIRGRTWLEGRGMGRASLAALGRVTPVFAFAGGRGLKGARRGLSPKSPIVAAIDKAEFFHIDDALDIMS